MRTIELQNKHKEEFEDCDEAEKARGANSTRTGRKSQASSSQLQETIKSTIPSIQLLLEN